jgi:predicted TIM-barrel fold metal-dependent hydrolase
MCQQLKVPVVFHTGENEGHPEVARFNDPKYIVEVAKRYPTLPVVITHYFWPKIDYCYEVTKNSPNIYFELAGTADKEVMEKSGGMEKMKKILEKTIQDRPDQVIFGSDWPLCSIESHIALVQSMQISTAHREYVFSKNAIKLYKLQLTG